MPSLARSYFKDGRREETHSMQKEVLTLRPEANGPKHTRTLSAIKALADSYVKAGG